MQDLQNSYTALSESKICRLHEFTVECGRIISVNCREHAYLSSRVGLPCLARGLFVGVDKHTGAWERVLLRGYDKFHNTGQTACTQWFLAPLRLTVGTGSSKTVAPNSRCA